MKIKVSKHKFNIHYRITETRPLKNVAREKWGTH